MITVYRSQKQKGATDCGLFAIANATAIVQGKNPSKLQFKQDLWGHIYFTVWPKEYVFAPLQVATI